MDGVRENRMASLERGVNKGMLALWIGVRVCRGWVISWRGCGRVSSEASVVGDTRGETVWRFLMPELSRLQQVQCLSLSRTGFGVASRILRITG